MANSTTVLPEPDPGRTNAPAPAAPTPTGQNQQGRDAAAEARLPEHPPDRRAEATAARTRDLHVSVMAWLDGVPNVQVDILRRTDRRST